MSIFSLHSKIMYFYVIKSNSSINNTYPVKSHPRNEIQCRIKCFCLSSQFIQNIHSVVWVWTVADSLDGCFIHSIECHALQLVQIGIYLHPKHTWPLILLAFFRGLLWQDGNYTYRQSCIIHPLSIIRFPVAIDAIHNIQLLILCNSWKTQKAGLIHVAGAFNKTMLAYKIPSGMPTWIVWCRL